MPAWLRSTVVHGYCSSIGKVLRGLYCTDYRGGPQSGKAQGPSLAAQSREPLHMAALGEARIPWSPGQSINARHAVCSL